MPTLLQVQNIPTQSAVEVVFSPADSEMECKEVGTNILLHVRNSSGAAVQVTVLRRPHSAKLSADVVTSIAAGTEAVVGVFPWKDFGYPGQVSAWTGNLRFQFDSTAGVSVAAIGAPMWVITGEYD